MEIIETWGNIENYIAKASSFLRNILYYSKYIHYHVRSVNF